MKLRNFKPEILAVGAAIFILAYVLMLRPVIGVADNGDFPRIMNSTGLHYLTADYNERYFNFVNRQYSVGIPVPFGGGYFSTEIFIVDLAVQLSRSVWNKGLFDIRYLSFLYILIFLAAIYFIVRYQRQKQGMSGFLAAVLLVFVFGDTGYISYFNSLYGEALSLVSLLLMTGAGIYLAVTAKPRLWGLILFFAAAVFFAGAKIQNSPVGILTALFSLRLLKLSGNKVWKRTVVFSAAIVLCVSILTFFAVSRDIKVCNKYQTVFYGILKDSPNPAGDLVELGLDPKLAVLAGTSYFLKEYPIDIRSAAFKNDIYKKVSHFKIAVFYLKHPDRFLKKLEISAENAFKLKQGIGNYEKYPGIEQKQIANIFVVWSDFKMKVIPHSLLFVFLFYTACLLALILEYFRRKDIRSKLYIELLALILLIGAIQFVFPVIGDGEADLSKHLFLFNVGFDMMFIAGVIYSVFRLSGICRLVIAKL